METEWSKQWMRFQANICWFETNEINEDRIESNRAIDEKWINICWIQQMLQPIWTFSECWKWSFLLMPKFAFLPCAQYSSIHKHWFLFRGRIVCQMHICLVRYKIKTRYRFFLSMFLSDISYRDFLFLFILHLLGIVVIVIASSQLDA